MRPQDLARLVALAAMWGGSYLFMRFAVPFFGPVWMIELRLAIAGIALAVFVQATGGRIGWSSHWRPYLVLAVTGLVLPFLLIAQAVTVIDASTAAILNSLSPFFTSIVAAIWIRDPITPAKAAGIVLCLAGTAVLVGWTPRPMSGAELLAASMSIGSTMLYGFATVYSKVRLRDASPMGISVATLLMAAAILAPIAPFSPAPVAAPAVAWLALLALGLLSTTVAYVFFYRLIADVGPVKAITVTLLVPVFGMIWGVVFLGEPVTPGRIAGCAIILSGCSLLLGLVRLPIPGTRRGPQINADKRR